ncbi:hypothetical protein BGZ60DRAFT_397029 [Tricladium varicosporioides]|nr:hypothetical protein BGZ60DRAFT_397029 [Hymenoscyphus varicosporioides]
MHFVSSSESTDGCVLSPSASAFSAMLSAFIGSVVNGLTSGWFVAFMTGWIAWFALFRVMLAGLYMLYRSSTDSWGPGKHERIPGPGEEDLDHLMNNDNSGFNLGEEVGRAPTQPSRFRILWPTAADVRTVGSDQRLWGTNKTVAQSLRDLDHGVSVLGWFGWIYGAVYAPITQSFWIAANTNTSSNGAAKIVKGLSIAVTALPLGMDCRVRYADSLKRKWAGTLFNLTNSISCVLQGIFCAILLVHGVIDLSASSSSFFPWPIVAIYPVFSLVWMYTSFTFLPIKDGARKSGKAHWYRHILDLSMGAFAGLFLAAPAFALYQSAQFAKFESGDRSNGMNNLASYLSCERQLWRKFVAVVP